jgi:hypothetical protein
MVRPEEGKPIDTGWVILVQERRDEVLQPVRDLQWRLGYWLAAAVLVLLAVVALMTVAMTQVLDGSSKSRVTRFLRRWAGLPTAGATGTGTARVSGIAAPGGKTIRADATPATGGSQSPETPRTPR